MGLCLTTTCRARISLGAFIFRYPLPVQSTITVRLQFAIGNLAAHLSLPMD